ncbi:hypothetical protein H696_06340, partial [Fonticula alba]
MTHKNNIPTKRSSKSTVRSGRPGAGATLGETRPSFGAAAAAAAAVAASAHPGPDSSYDGPWPTAELHFREGWSPSVLADFTLDDLAAGSFSGVGSCLINLLYRAFEPRPGRSRDIALLEFSKVTLNYSDVDLSSLLVAHII